MSRTVNGLVLGSVFLMLGVTIVEAATHTRVKYVPIEPRPGTITVEVSQHIVTSIQALDEIIDWDLGNGLHYTAAKNSNDPRRMTLQPKVAIPHYTTLQVLFGGHWYNLELKVARDVKPVSSVIFVPTKDDIPLVEPTATSENPQPDPISETEKQQAVSEALSNQRNEYEGLIKDIRTKSKQALIRSEESALLMQLRESAQLRNARSCSGGKLTLCKQHWTLFKKYGVLYFLLSNLTGSEQVINAVAIHDEFGASNHVGLVSVAGREPTESTAVDTTLAPGQSVVVAVSVRSPAQVGRRVKVALSTVGRSLPMYTTINLDPEPKEGEGLITLTLSGMAGAVWLANPVDAAQLGATSTTGLEMRVRYGFNRHWSFEAALAGASIGEASWDGMMYDSAEGALVRYATLGRLLLGGVLHFGDKYRPMIRAGLGVQGVSHQSRFIPTVGQDREGPGGGFAANGLYYIGLGLEAELGRHWTAGLSANFVEARDPAIQFVVEGGINLSYRWSAVR